MRSCWVWRGTGIDTANQHNPQLVGGRLMVLGIFVCQPSLYNLGWVLLWAVIGHWMVTQEEIHLRRMFGEEYQALRPTKP